MPNNPYRLTVRWITTDAFPNARVVLGNDPPRWDFGITSSWYIPPVSTSQEAAQQIEHLLAGMPFAYSRDQLRVLAVQMRKSNVPLTRPMAYPWNAEGIDPYGDPALMFQCEYKGKQQADTLQMWLAEIKIEG